MSTLRSKAHVLAAERGATIPELLVFAVALLVILATVSMLIITSVTLQPGISERNAAVQQGRVLQERLARELRQGGSVQSATASQVTFRTFVRRQTCASSAPLAATAPAILCQVTYSCSAGTCTRSETNPTGSVTPRTEELVSGISNAAVFSYLPSTADPSYVTTTLVFPADDGEDAITLKDGAELRNG